VTERTRETGRRQSRRVALVLLYQHDVTPERPLDELYARYRSDAKQEVPAYADELVQGVLEDTGRLDVLIGEHAHGWTVDRISPIERAALRIAVLELAEHADVPASVAIDEAVRLSKRYASPEAGVFVNGVLGGVARALGVGH
jgi:N utilization substance protein B